LKKAARVAFLPFLIIALILPTKSAQAARRTWTVIVGGASRDWSIQAQGFFPRTIEIAVDDTIQWKFEGIHTVTFLGRPGPTIEWSRMSHLNPHVYFPSGGKVYDGKGYRNSGVPPVGVAPGETLQSTLARHRYALAFTKLGTFQYICVLHPGMVGTVVVKERVSGSSEAALTRGRQEHAAVLKAGLAAWSKQEVEQRGNTVVVPMIGDRRNGYSIFRFSRQPLVVKRRTTVSWKMADPWFEIHTVTFLGGEGQPKLILTEPQKQGVPKLRFHPRVEERTSVRRYAGKGYANSGLLFTPGSGPPSAPSEFSLTFTLPGRYEYLCLIHVPEGMTGTIIVK